VKLADQINKSIGSAPEISPNDTELVYRTGLGAMYVGKSESFLISAKSKRTHGKVQLVFTSPPFPLNERKRYGNLTGRRYINWLASFAPLFRDVLTEDGSIVIEIGNAWEPGRPVMSTVVLEALLKFLKRGGLHLCQEFIWYNSARLPSPVQWVNVERVRVKDAFTRFWWMSPSERPKADNRRVLREYGADMKKLIKTGHYNAGIRPSEHRVGQRSFARDNGGAIPPNVFYGEQAESVTNLLKGSNTSNRDQYQLFCREKEIPAHPARMPAELAEFFIRFLTDNGDLVLDPFAGSNTTGAVAETLGRHWISCEAEWQYAAPSIVRFPPEEVTKRHPLLGAMRSDLVAPA
jgi:site-specific DNA-methyltransferase (cytosine-N4-specific)